MLVTQKFGSVQFGRTPDLASLTTNMAVKKHSVKLKIERLRITYLFSKGLI